MASRYVYPSQLPTHYIRLLTLVSDSENFRGSIEEFSKDDLPYFDAISWCWPNGKENYSTSFECNGHLFPVSQQLYNLLSSLSQKNAHSSVRIWIDSICINQNNIEEKNEHVSRMHEIYGLAQKVIVWLGMPESGSDMVMDSQRISELNTALQLLPNCSIAQTVTAPDLPHAEDPIWKAIGRLCDRDWFYRTWIIQEISLAHKAELLCGKKCLGWDDFVNLVHNIGRVGLTSICRGARSTGTTRPDGFGVLMDLSWTRTMVQNDAMSLSYILHMVRLKEVTKPVDKVYGLLGIIGEDVRRGIKVDYVENDRQYWKAFVELAKQIIATDDRAFWLLCMASSRERPEQLPTWCPNFNCPTEYLDFGDQKWRAGIGDKPVKVGGIHVLPGTSSIQVPGFRIDRVNKVVHIGGPYSAIVGGPAAFLDRDMKCLELALYHFDDANKARNAYARTLILNSWIDGLPVQQSQAEEVGQAYEDCKAHLTQIVGSIAVSNHILTDERLQLAQQYITQLVWWQERPFFTTENGRIGRGAFNMRTGDAVCVFYQAGPVFLIRSEQGSDAWKLVGDGYLHGCMDLDSMPGTGRELDTKFTIS